MKFRSICQLLAACLVAGMVISCKQASSDAVTPTSSTCQVQSISTVYAGKTAGSTSARSFSYDAKGQLTSVVESTSLSSGGNSRTTETYTYDDNGYATAYKKVISQTGQSDRTTNETYAYTGGRLTTITAQENSYVTQTGTTTYTYDASGGLTQTAYTATGNFSGITFTSSTVNTYANGQLAGVKSLYNGKESATYTISNGLITTVVYSGGSKTRYTYDTDSNQIKSEDSNSAGAVTSTLTTEYGTTAAPKSVYPDRKGFPAVSTGWGLNSRNVARTTYTSTGQSPTVSEYQGQLNSNGYPTKSVNTTTNATTTTTYTYSNCQ